MEEELSFETLLKLRNEVGLKTFQQFEKEKFYGRNQQQPSKKRPNRSTAVDQHDPDSDNNEPPLEISSKHPFKKNKPSRKWRTEQQSQEPQDPRFSDRYGKLNDEKFKKNFKFAIDLRAKELESLKQAREQEEEEEKEAAKRKYLIQRMENQKRESIMRKKKPASKTVEILKDGTKFFKTRKVQRTEELVKKFIALKESGKLEKHLDKRRKKKAGQERKKMNIEK